MITSRSLIKHSKTGTEGALRVTNSLRLLLLHKPNPAFENEISVFGFKNKVSPDMSHESLANGIIIALKYF